MICRRSATLADEKFFQILFAESHADAPTASKSAASSSLEALYQESQQNYANDFPYASDYLLHLQDGTPVGRLLLAKNNGAWRIVSVTISAAHRGRGLGSEVIRQCQRECADAVADLHLRVAHGNPARRLYERLGFRPLDRCGSTIEMVWRVSRDGEN